MCVMLYLVPIQNQKMYIKKEFLGTKPKLKQKD